MMHVGAQYVGSLKHLWVPCSIHFHPIFLLSHPTQQWPFWWMTMVSQATGPPTRQEVNDAQPWCWPRRWLAGLVHEIYLVIGGGFKYFFVFTPVWGRYPIWLIFFKGVETTNQLVIGEYNFVCKFWISVLIYYHRGCTLSRLDLGLLFEQCKKPWLVRLYRGLYYPIIKGL